jgi:hypothetical protein
MRAVVWSVLSKYRLEHVGQIVWVMRSTMSGKPSSPTPCSVSHQAHTRSKRTHVSVRGELCMARRHRMMRARATCGGSVWRRIHRQRSMTDCVCELQKQDRGAASRRPASLINVVACEGARGLVSGGELDGHARETPARTRVGKA